MAKKKTAKKEIHVVKRHGHREKFDERKAYASVYAACLAAHQTELTAEKAAAEVCKDLRKWIDDRKAVTSHQLHRQITGYLKKHDRNASFMYETHRDVS
ncbi:hypothetical protein HYX10_04940 [Candidatus Woesearchaeota archaeon]|nr:hypothetical protein [Candidatus Woesearchaeota archaeon]